MPIQFDNTNTGSVTLKGPASSTSTLTWPASIGTSNQILTTNGSGTLSWVALGSPSVAGFTLTAASNSIAASGGTTNQGAAIVPKGSGGFCLNVPDSAATGGDARGLYSVDLVAIRDGSSKVASGLRSVSLGGYGHTVSGPKSVIGGGYWSVASGSASYILGGNSASVSANGAIILGRSTSGSAYVTTANSDGLTILGGYTNGASQTFTNLAYGVVLPRPSANASYIGGFSYASFSTQLVEVQLGGVTTNSTPKELTTNAAAVGTNNYITYGTTTVIHGEAVARASDGTTKTWYFRYAGTSENVFSGTVTVISADAGASAWDFAISGISGSRFTFTATGDVALTTRWLVRVVQV